MTDLTIRLLAEIERREGRADYRYRYGDSTHAEETLAYLAALRKIVELHGTETPDRHGCGGNCLDCMGPFPCHSLLAVAEFLGVEA